MSNYIKRLLGGRRSPYGGIVSNKKGFVMPTLIAFMSIIVLLGYATIMIALQAYRNSERGNYATPAQLAAISGLEYAKEQYEIDINYQGGGEVELPTNSSGGAVTTYEVVHLGFTNAVNTQQDVKVIGRVYKADESEPVASRTVFGKLTRDNGANASSRFVFIVDNSGSMSVGEWQQSKQTVDTAINYVLENTNTAQVAVVQYGTNTHSQEHKYDVTVPFTLDASTATNWTRRYGHGTAASQDEQDHLAASLARMRHERVYSAGSELDLEGANSVQYVVFTDAHGTSLYTHGCCSALKKTNSETYDTTNNGSFVTLDQHGEFNHLKDGTVFSENGYPDINSQFTVLNVNTASPDLRETKETSAAIASPGGDWDGVVDANPGDPEGEGVVPRRFVSTSLLVDDPDEILSILAEVIESELIF